ncbi:MAG TPA: magnesium transporter CorA family protein [Candidatus Paceibacterota bacterium]|nr:magnesium transporter CorA family protein [Candidatus Paceibacterota bacterium]
MDIKKGKGVQWIDIHGPAEKDLQWLGTQFGIHPVIMEELRGPSARARVEAYKNYLYFVYYFPLYDKEDEASIRTEIDFVITKDSVITVHYEPMKDVYDGFEVRNATSSLDIMYGLIEHLINFEERQLRHIREKVETVGKAIFRGNEMEILQRITYVKRDISEYRIVARLQGPILNSLVIKGRKFWGEDAEVYLNDLMGDQMKIVNQLEDYREAISDFEDTNNQLMNLKINSVMKTFTSLSFLTFPFVLLAAIFSMNTRDTPIVNMPGAFWIVTGSMACAMALLTIYFKRKGWF